MSTAIGHNPYSRQWRPPNEPPKIPDERMRHIYQYQQCLRAKLSKKIKRSYLFVEGMQLYDEHFQRVFRACFTQMRGGAALIKDASNINVRLV